jgi:hypothetical protein
MIGYAMTLVVSFFLRRFILSNTRTGKVRRMALAGGNRPLIAMCTTTVRLAESQKREL